MSLARCDLSPSLALNSKIAPCGAFCRVPFETTKSVSNFELELVAACLPNDPAKPMEAPGCYRPIEACPCCLESR